MNIEQVRFNMIEQQIRTWDVLDTDVLDLLHALKREQFVPAMQKNFALMDIETPLAPISATQKMWQPRVEARVLQDLALKGSEHVLEVGSGSGYLTALLASRAKQVVSVEIDPALAKFATENLCTAGITNATVSVGDASKGWAKSAKYDVIVFTGSMEVIPDEIFAQLNEAGRVFAIVGKAPVMHAKIARRVGESLIESTLFETVVAPLVNAAKAPAFVF
ncbi:MAG: protein-L-isoaspartate O-methyltransferase family protein [Casimicrobium sp.]